MRGTSRPHGKPKSVEMVDGDDGFSREDADAKKPKASLFIIVAID